MIKSSGSLFLYRVTSWFSLLFTLYSIFCGVCYMVSEGGCRLRCVSVWFSCRGDRCCCGERPFDSPTFVQLMPMIGCRACGMLCRAWRGWSPAFLGWCAHHENAPCVVQQYCCPVSLRDGVLATVVQVGNDSSLEVCALHAKTSQVMYV